MQNSDKSQNCNGDRYQVEFIPTEAIKPSPENDGLYGKIDVSSKDFDPLFYDALSRLVTSARYLGNIPFSAVDDPTRRRVLH
jgi:hypothetical protein